MTAWKATDSQEFDSRRAITLLQGLVVVARRNGRRVRRRSGRFQAQQFG